MDTERSVVPAAAGRARGRVPGRAGGCLGFGCRRGGGGLVPSFVAFPASTDEASALLRVAAAHDLSVVPRGAGTGLGWGPAACVL